MPTTSLQHHLRESGYDLSLNKQHKLKMVAGKFNGLHLLTDGGDWF